MTVTRPETIGKVSIIVGVALFAVLLDTLFIPAGPDVGPILLGVITLAAVVLLVAGVVKKG